MSGTKPDADERRIQDRLRKLVDGPTVEPPPMPPGPPPDGYQPAAEDTWWDDLYGDEQPKPEPRQAAPRLPNWWSRKPTDLTTDDTDDTGEEPDEDEQEPVEEPADPDPTRAPAPRPPKRRTARPTYRDDQPHPHRQSLLDAYDRIPNRIRWLIYHATAATAGYRIGWVDWGTDTAAWYADGHWLTPSAFALYGLGFCACALYRRSRTWAWPIAWAAAVPVSSVIAGIALYGTGYQP
jgi:hypothetical protein